VNARQHIELTQGHPGDPGSWLDEVGFETASARVMRDYLGVRDMQKAIDQLHKNGLAPDSKFADDKSEIGRDGKWQFDIFDPDFTRIEFMEPAPVKDPCCNAYSAPHAKL
jgi:hypothetical protein